MGSIRDSAPDPNRASGSARQPWPPLMRPHPTSKIAAATPPRPLPGTGHDIRKDVKTTMIYTQVLNRGATESAIPWLPCDPIWAVCMCLRQPQLYRTGKC